MQVLIYNTLKISIITPSYAQGRFIEETMLSVLDNGYENVEYIVIDGGSKDDTIDIIKKYEKRLKYWVSEKDSGQTDAINKGLAHVTGDIVAYLNSDDYYLPGTLEKVASFFDSNPMVDFYTGQTIFVDENSKPADGFPELFQREITDESMISTCIIAQPSTFFRRRVLNKVPRFDESLHFAMDYDFWLKSYILGFKFYKTMEELSAFRLHSDSKTEGLYHTGAFAYDFVKLYGQNRILDRSNQNVYQRLILTAQVKVIHLLFVNLEGYRGTSFAKKEISKILLRYPYVFLNISIFKLLISLLTPVFLRKIKRKLVPASTR